MDLLEVKHKKKSDLVTSRHPWELARLVVFKKLISKHINLNDKSIVFDIGCGDTFLVEQLAMDYPDALFYAIDIAFTDEMIKQYTEKLKVKNVLLYRSVEEFASEEFHTAALIILADVIEHIEDDKKFMTALLQHKFVGKNTFFLITVPAFQSLFFSHDIFLGHYRRYTNKILKNNLSSAGLRVIKIGYLFFSLLPIRLCQVMKEKITGFNREKNSTGLTTWEGSDAKSNLLKKILLMDVNFSFSLKKVGINLPGLSNYAICKKFL